MSESTEDKLARSIASSLNRSKSGGAGKIAHFLNDQDSPTNVSRFVPTGSTVLDMLISNQPNGGLPVGKIVEFYGLPATGKSLIASHVLAHTQKMGGLAVYIDTESAAKPEFLETIGINLNNLVYIAQNRAEHIFAVIEKCIQKVKKEDSNRFITVVVDSIAGMTTENEDSADYSKQGYATDKAIILSKAMRKINKMIGSEQVLLLFTNQVRHSMNMYGPEYTTPGGQAVPFHSSVRVQLRKSKTITKTISGKKQQVGAKLRPKVEKNRLAPSGRSCDFDLFFNTGIDDVGSWWNVLKDHNWINQSSRGWYYVVGEKDDDGNSVSWWTGEGSQTSNDKDDATKIQEGRFTEYAKKDPEFKAFLRSRLEKSILVTYNQDWTGDDDLEYTEDDTTTVSDDD